ncbi:hypothetical protein ES705_45042 [subsurface metagenome]
MNTKTVIKSIESVITENEVTLSVDQVHALYFAAGVLRTLPAFIEQLIDNVFDVANPPQ